MNLVLLASHGIAEYDDVRMFHDLGFGIFAPGGYENPAEPGESLRPALPEVPYHQELAQACWDKRAEHAQEDASYAIDWAKADLPDAVVDWGDAFIFHHFPDRWIPSNWDRLKGKRVIWRTCGQSNPGLESYMAEYPGLEIVRYSPAERRYFESINAFAGETALIRFGKYPADYGPWDGSEPVVGNVTQHMAQRGDATGYTFWLAATDGLPARPAGPGSEELPGGIGALSYDEMREYLRRCRAYLYTGTTPAPYTLGLIEAMLTGTPIVSIGPSAWRGPDELFEGHELVAQGPISKRWDGRDGRLWSDDPAVARRFLQSLLSWPDNAQDASTANRERAEALFSVTVVGPQWKALLA